MKRTMVYFRGHVFSTWLLASVFRYLIRAQLIFYPLQATPYFLYNELIEDPNYVPEIRTRFRKLYKTPEGNCVGRKSSAFKTHFGMSGKRKPRPKTDGSIEPISSNVQIPPEVCLSILDQLPNRKDVQAFIELFPQACLLVPSYSSKY